MFRLAFVFVCAMALGVLLRDQADDYLPKRKAMSQPYAAPAQIERPVACDATVEYKNNRGDKWIRKCYIRGMRI